MWSTNRAEYTREQRFNSKAFCAGHTKLRSNSLRKQQLGRVGGRKSGNSTAPQYHRLIPGQDFLSLHSSGGAGGGVGYV